MQKKKKKKKKKKNHKFLYKTETKFISKLVQRETLQTPHISLY